MRAFRAERGITTATLCAWRRRLASERLPGLELRPNPRHSGKPGRKPYPPEGRRKAVEAFAKSGMTAVSRGFGWDADIVVVRERELRRVTQAEHGEAMIAPDDGRLSPSVRPLRRPTPPPWGWPGSAGRRSRAQKDPPNSCSSPGRPPPGLSGNLQRAGIDAVWVP